MPTTIELNSHPTPDEIELYLFCLRCKLKYLHPQKDKKEILEIKQKIKRYEKRI